MRPRAFTLACACSIWLVQSPTRAQEQVESPPADELSDLVTIADRQKYQSSSPLADGLHDLVTVADLQNHRVHRAAENTDAPTEVVAAYWEQRTARYLYWHQYWERRKRVFEWHHTSGIVLFWTVILMTVAGLGMAIWQFGKDKPVAGHPTHTIEISRDGLKLSSSFAGIVVVCLSFGFLYLYLRHVYPINFVRESRITSEDVWSASAAEQGSSEPQHARQE